MLSNEMLSRNTSFMVEPQGTVKANSIDMQNEHSDMASKKRHISFCLHQKIPYTRKVNEMTREEGYYQHKSKVREDMSTANDEDGYVDDKGRGHESVEIDQRLQVYYSENGDACQLTARY